MRCPICNIVDASRTTPIETERAAMMGLLVGHHLAVRDKMMQTALCALHARDFLTNAPRIRGNAFPFTRADSKL